MKTALLASLAGAFVAGTGCVHYPYVRPAPNATLVAPGVAAASAAGVRVTVAGGTWRGHPHDLDAVLTPLEVTIETASDRPIRVSYQDIALIGGSGFRYLPSSPVNLQEGGKGSAPRAKTSFTPALGLSSGSVELAYHRRFYVAPGWGIHYRGWYGWPYWHGWPYPWGYYYYPWPAYPYEYYDWPVSLPTADMIQRALPEGVVDRGGHVGGFLYFRGVSPREQTVTFQMSVVDASSGEQLGLIDIPLVVQR